MNSSMSLRDCLELDFILTMDLFYYNYSRIVIVISKFFVCVMFM